MKRLCFCVALLAWGFTARAAGSCSITNAASGLVDFGVYNNLGLDTDGIGTLNLSCTPIGLPVPVTYTISINAGGASGFNPRYLSAGGYSLNYNLYVDPTRLIIWGDGTAAGTQKVSGACLGSCPVTVYGRIFGGQSVPAMRFNDSVLVTLEF